MDPHDAHAAELSPAGVALLDAPEARPQPQAAASLAVTLRGDVARHNDITTLRLVGDLDLAGQAILADTLARLRPIRGTLVVDLAGVEFIDCSGMHSLLEVQQATVADSSRRPVLVRCSPGALRLFRLSGMLDVFDIANKVGRSAPEADASARTERDPLR